MEKILELVFKNEDGDTKVVTVVDPREDITAEEAHEAMEIIITAANIAVSKRTFLFFFDMFFCLSDFIATQLLYILYIIYNFARNKYFIIYKHKIQEFLLRKMQNNAKKWTKLEE